MGEYLKLNRQQAQEKFQPGAPGIDAQPKNELEGQLFKDGIARVELSIDKAAFQQLSDQYDVCHEEHRRWLDWTSGSFDAHGIPEDGHVRKELKFNSAGMQIADPKMLFHFNDTLESRWVEEKRRGKIIPVEFMDFMEHGRELRHKTTQAAIDIALRIESYDGLDELLFPKVSSRQRLSSTTLRLLRYDSYRTRDDDGNLIVEQDAQVAKAHYDRGGMTIQAYASAPGFWMQPEGARGAKYQKYYPPHGEGQSQVFFGAGYRAVYGTKTPISPLYHGVDRIFDESQDHVPVRTAAILFVDPPLVDLKMKSHETQPERIDKHNLNV